jgi:hypothetical protein
MLPPQDPGFSHPAAGLPEKTEDSASGLNFKPLFVIYFVSEVGWANLKFQFPKLSTYLTI